MFSNIRQASKQKSLKELKKHFASKRSVSTQNKPVKRNYRCGKIDRILYFIFQSYVCPASFEEWKKKIFNGCLIDEKFQQT